MQQDRRAVAAKAANGVANGVIQNTTMTLLGDN